MAFYLNKVQHSGVLVRDPELKQLSTGTLTCSFSLAITRPVKDKEGNYLTDFFDYVAWGKTGEAIKKFFKKGSTIYVDGELQQRRWKTNSGESKSKVEINVQGFKFVEPKKDKDSDSSSGFSGDALESSFTELDSSEELPF